MKVACEELTLECTASPEVPASPVSGIPKRSAVPIAGLLLSGLTESLEGTNQSSPSSTGLTQEFSTLANEESGLIEPEVTKPEISLARSPRGPKFCLKSLTSQQVPEKDHSIHRLSFEERR